MKIKVLVVHLAKIPEWTHLAIETEGIDFAKNYEPTLCNNNADLMAMLEKVTEK